VRKLYDNLTVTTLSVVVALFAATWAIAIAAWRLGRVEERWGIADGG
jgi:high-affinity nickel permease